MNLNSKDIFHQNKNHNKILLDLFKNSQLKNIFSLADL